MCVDVALFIAGLAAKFVLQKTKCKERSIQINQENGNKVDDYFLSISLGGFINTLQSKSKSKNFFRNLKYKQFNKKSCPTNNTLHLYIQTEPKAYRYMQRYMLGKNLHRKVSQN